MWVCADGWKEGRTQIMNVCVRSHIHALKYIHTYILACAHTHARELKRMLNSKFSNIMSNLWIFGNPGKENVYDEWWKSFALSLTHTEFLERTHNFTGQCPPTRSPIPSSPHYSNDILDTSIHKHKWNFPKILKEGLSASRSRVEVIEHILIPLRLSRPKTTDVHNIHYSLL